MKNLACALIVAVILFSCQTAPKQYFSASPEIELIKKTNAAYVSGDFKTMRTAYVDTAKVYDNTWDPEKALTPDGFLTALQTNLEKYSEYKIGDDAIYEMIINDEGQKWVHNWFLWSGKHENGTVVEMPIHISFLMVDNKVAFQANMYNMVPAYLANQPQPLAQVETPTETPK